MGILKKDDKIRIKSLEWYNENSPEDCGVETEGNTFVTDMKIYCGREAIITNYVSDIHFYIDIDDGNWGWTIGMIETGDMEMNGESIFKFGDFYVKVNLETKTVFPEFFNTYQEAKDYEYSGIF